MVSVSDEAERRCPRGGKVLSTDATLRPDAKKTAGSQHADPCRQRNDNPEQAAAMSSMRCGAHDPRATPDNLGYARQ